MVTVAGSNPAPAVDSGRPRAVGRRVDQRQMTVWFYGKNDSTYSMDHSRKNLDAFRQTGGKGRYHEVAIWGGGQWLLSNPPVWENAVSSNLDEMDK